MMAKAIFIFFNTIQSVSLSKTALISGYGDLSKQLCIDFSDHFLLGGKWIQLISYQKILIYSFFF